MCSASNMIVAESEAGADSDSDSDLGTLCSKCRQRHSCTIVESWADAKCNKWWQGEGDTTHKSKAKAKALNLDKYESIC